MKRQTIQAPTTPEIHKRTRIRLPSSLCKPSLRAYFDWDDKGNDDYTKRPILLDLFAGSGGAAMGYYLAGFRVVGVDIEHQKNVLTLTPKTNMLPQKTQGGKNMPNTGDKIRAGEVGYNHNRLMIWSRCQDCNYERWVETRNGVAVCGPRCQKCAASHYGKITPKYKGKDHWHWKGGRSKMTNGYIEIWMDPSDPFYPMSYKDGYLTEHRLVMAKHLGRMLKSNEIVHHKNRNKHDNRIENLELLSRSDHCSLLKEINRLSARINELEIENAKLKAKAS